VETEAEEIGEAEEAAKGMEEAVVAVGRWSRWRGCD
jgi:hypothetical protein